MYLNYEVIIKGKTFQVTTKEQVFEKIAKDRGYVKYFKRNLNKVSDITSLERHCNISSCAVAEQSAQKAVIKLIKNLFEENRSSVRTLLKSNYITAACSEHISPVTGTRLIFVYFYSMKKPLIENRAAVAESYI